MTVVYGTADGLSTLAVQWLSEHLLYGPGTSEQGDYFGRALAAGDFDGDGIDDLAIGADGENHEDSGFVNVGAVTVVPGRLYQGLTGAARRLRPIGGLSLDPPGLIPDYQAGAGAWGAALASGDFDGNGYVDLAIGAPHRDLYHPAYKVDTGAVSVLYGSSFADGFEYGTTAAWSAAGP